MGKGDEARGHCPRCVSVGHVSVIHMGQNPRWLRSASWLVNMVLFIWDMWLARPCVGFDLGW